MTTLDCGHVFHLDCVHALRRSNALNGVSTLCPLCRFPIKPFTKELYKHATSLLLQARSLPNESPQRKAQFEEAETLLRWVIEQEPMHELAYSYLGFIMHVHKQDYLAAETAYREALKLNPRQVGARHNLGVILVLNKANLPGAMDAFRAVLDINPSHPFAHSNLGMLLLCYEKDYEGAEAEYQAAISCKIVGGLTEGMRRAHQNLRLLLEGFKRDVDVQRMDVQRIDQGIEEDTEVPRSIGTELGLAGCHSRRQRPVAGGGGFLPSYFRACFGAHTAQR
jgi:tetratricopeptide (TPR) repeat protein